jgi:phage shock protein PspC (stress-responsive transcriptional regulator)
MKKLHRVVEDRKIAGVCGGLGDYFDLDPVFFRLFFLMSLLFGGLGERFEIDPVLFRVAFILLALACGLGILLYIALWLLVPRRSTASDP